MRPHELTVGITDDQLGPRRPVVPWELDEPDEGACSLCGHVGSWPVVMRTELRNLPGVVSRRCTDSVACLRRRPRR